MLNGDGNKNSAKKPVGLTGGFHVTSSPSCWWTVNKRSLISSLCLSTSICSFHHCYLCLPRLHENHLLAKKQLCTCSTLFMYISLLLFCTTITRNFQKLPNYTFYGGNVVCVPVHFLFATAHFYLAGR